MKKIGLIVLSLLIVTSCLVNVEPIVATSEVENTWTNKAPIPQADGGHVRATTVNGKIYVIGGSINYEYDPTTDNWAEKTPMPTPRHWFGIAVYQNKIYTIGGSAGWTQENGTIYSSANEVYDPSTDTWENKTSMPTTREEVDASIVNGKIHLLATDTHDVYDIATDSWATKTAMPFPYTAYAASSTAFNDMIYLIGWNLTQIYDPNSDSWSLGASPPTSVSNVAVCATTGVMAPKRIYVFGGSVGFLEYTNVTQVYDPENDTWVLGAPMPTARAGLTVAVENDVIYAIGGGHSWGQTESVNERYVPFGYGTPDSSFSGTIAEYEYIVLFLVSVAIVVLVSAGFIVYFKKHKRQV